MTYKSAELCREEQAIVEGALNRLAEEGTMGDEKAIEESNEKLRRMIAALTHKRKLTLP
jgi:hypothetical protein